ncbi:MAG: LLM class flavin-dependent oxidoreductase [Salinivirgaceae bacterium]|nr:LLM class flavin-dependent oxidoreductase [Salinivirgaceae bacterium]
MNKIKFYLGLQGNKTPDEYIKIAKTAEKNGFDRLYVYDDLLYYPSFPILTTIAHHTKKIKLGPCLVNGFYRHPAVITSSYAYLNQVSNNRAVLGLGRGAFYDLLKLESEEEYTRKGYEETIQLVKHFLEKDHKVFEGEIHKATEKAFLKVPAPKNPYIITATWNYNMAYIAGKYSNELQVAEVWNEKYLGELYHAFLEGKKENKIKDLPRLSIGGMMCVANSEKEAIRIAKPTVAVYMPYLQTILKSHNIDFETPEIQKIFELSKSGKISEAVKLLSDDITKVLALVGTPDQVAERVNNLRKKYPIHGLLLSPPYGTSNDVVKNIKYLKKELFKKLY